MVIDLTDVKTVKKQYVIVKKVDSITEAMDIEKYIVKTYAARTHDMSMFNISNFDPHIGNNIFFFYPKNGRKGYYGICTSNQVRMYTYFNYNTPEKTVMAFARSLRWNQ